ncbi:hypothetical protein [Erythrobacter ani]|uniref:Uncharacterized protein n=1 Tax=Erythrobacter ani TaxID=2827235 RepID=A0ABS6SPK8_9SPHN|nr:hypothetical protein [Erythrobacter ani]MBV7266417.1 hypothetical protein [Erythrobacter ani]
MTVPPEITHYYSRSDRPFQNLSDLPPGELAEVLAALNERKANNPDFKRVFGGRYMDLRRKTERKLLRLFKERGGKPGRQSPHYFVLGECAWFSGLYPDPEAVKLDWRTLAREQVSFTYPDSFISMRLGAEFGLPPEPLKPYHEKVFLLDELEDVVAEFGLPNGAEDDEYDGYHKREFEKYIEVQLWSDRPVVDILQRRNR